MRPGSADPWRCQPVALTKEVGGRTHTRRSRAMGVEAVTNQKHVPVMLDRIVDLLAPALADGGVLVDCTTGHGGHTEAVLERIPGSRVIGIDRDTYALGIAGERLARFGDRWTGVHAVYDEILDVVAGQGLDEVQAVLFDLGVSSMQLDQRERGFAYAEDAPLDMRMDATRGQTAADVLNNYSAADLTRILRRLRRGEVRQEDRLRHRQASRDGAVHDERASGGASLRGDPGTCPSHRRTSGQAHLPGAADGGQRRARGAAYGTAGLARGRRRRWPGGGRVLPLARGPAHQAGLHRGDQAGRTSRHAVRAARGPSRRSACSPVVPSRPTKPRSRRTRAPPRCDCARWSAPSPEPKSLAKSNPGAAR